MANPKLKLFLVPFEWLPDYGNEIRVLNSKTHKGASREVQKMLDKPVGPPVPEGYTVMEESQLHAMLRSIQDALDLWASVHWTVDDVMAQKKCSRAKALEWMQTNSKYLTDASVRGGWDAIQTL